MKFGRDTETGKWYVTQRRPFHLILMPCMWVAGIVMTFHLPWSTLEGIRILGGVLASIAMVGVPAFMFWEEWRLREIPPPPGYSEGEEVE